MYCDFGQLGCLFQVFVGECNFGGCDGQCCLSDVGVVQQQWFGFVDYFVCLFQCVDLLVYECCGGQCCEMLIIVGFVLIVCDCLGCGIGGCGVIVFGLNVGDVDGG